MFLNCKKLKRIIFPPKLYGISYLGSTFENCYELDYIDLSGFDENEDIHETFRTFKNCKNLTSLRFPKIEADQLKNAQEMFSGCTKLKYLDMGDFRTIYIENMKKMFYNCNSLVFLNISNFNTNFLSSADNIFTGVNLPIKVIVNEHVGNGKLEKELKTLNRTNITEI